MNKEGRKTYWRTTQSGNITPRRINTPQPSRRTCTVEVEDVQVEYDDEPMAFSTKSQVREQIIPAVYTGAAEPLFDMGDSGISSAVPFTQTLLNGTYGYLFAGVNRLLLANINGQGPNAPSPNILSQGLPGSPGMKIPVGVFFCSLAPAITSPKSRYLLAPKYVQDSGGNDLAVNGLTGRLIVLVRGESVQFIVDPALANVKIGLNNNQIGVYFSTFPFAGTNSTSVNQLYDSCEAGGGIGIQASGNGCCMTEETVLPGLVVGTSLMYPGTTTIITPTSNWGFLVFLCCTASFAMYCPVIVVSLARATC